MRDLRAELLAAEAAHFAKTKGLKADGSSPPSKPDQRELDALPAAEPEDENPEAKRRRILEETRDIDADSEGAGSDGSDEESDEEDEDEDEEDETAELMRELEKIKRERAEQKAKEVGRTTAHVVQFLTVNQDAEKAKEAQEQREEDIALGNPLLNPHAFNVKRRWDDDVVFKNQARGTEQKRNKEFVNVCAHSGFVAQRLD